MPRALHARLCTPLQHRSAPFKVADIYRWIVVVSSPKHVEELRRAPDDTLSFAEAIKDVSNCFLQGRLTGNNRHQQSLQVEYTMGAEIHYNPYHIPIIRSQLTRNIGVLYPEVRSEMAMAFDDVFDLRGIGKHLVLICVRYSLMHGTTRMEEYSSAQQHAKGDLQNEQQSVCRPSIM